MEHRPGPEAFSQRPTLPANHDPISADDIWAAGQNLTHDSQELDFLLEHWDGTQRSIVDSPNIKPGNSPNALFGVTAVATNDVWACGTWDDSVGNQHTLVEHRDGNSWSLVSAPDPVTSNGESNNVLFAGVAPSPHNLWLFGGRFGGTPGHILDSLVLLYHKRLDHIALPDAKACAFSHRSRASCAAALATVNGKVSQESQVKLPNE